MKISASNSPLSLSQWNHVQCRPGLHCAPWALLRAVGGSITDLWGHPLVYDPRRLGHDNGLVASHGPHHADILAAIRPLVDDWYRSPH